MSRRTHHANRRHTRGEKGSGEARPAQPATDPGPGAEAQPVFDTTASIAQALPEPGPQRHVAAPKLPVAAAAGSETVPGSELDDVPAAEAEVPARGPEYRPAPPDPQAGSGSDGETAGCTAPQLRRFIKSRAYVPMHELRRRFGLSGDDDDVTGVEVDREHRVYVGLPNREGNLLGELFRAGDVGYELSLDPISPIVVGVFPMRPIARG